MFTRGDLDKIDAYMPNLDLDAAMVDMALVPEIVWAATRVGVLADETTAVHTAHNEILFMYHPRETALSVASRAVKEWEMKLPSAGMDAVVRVLTAAYVQVGLIKQDLRGYRP